MVDVYSCVSSLFFVFNGTLLVRVSHVVDDKKRSSSRVVSDPVWMEWLKKKEFQYTLLWPSFVNFRFKRSSKYMKKSFSSVPAWYTYVLDISSVTTLLASRNKVCHSHKTELSRVVFCIHPWFVIGGGSFSRKNDWSKERMESTLISEK